jgi:predicted DNA-binding transcriptional regulator AlpA
MATANATLRATGVKSRLLSEVEAAERLNLPRRTLSTWRQRGGGPRFVKLKSVVRYPEDALDEFVAAGVRDNTSQQEPAP